MWLGRLARFAAGSKHVYSIVFFAVLTWNVVRSQYGKGRQEWQTREPQRRPWKS